MQRISIIIPVYNAEKYIHECLESIYKQGLDENTFEVIVVDDGSKDKSMENISDLIEKHSNLKIITQSNQGVSIARNNGLKIAQGTYVWFIDADDLLTDNCLREMLDIAEKNTLDILKISYVMLWENPSESSQAEATPSTSHPYNLICKSGQEGFIENFNPLQGNVWQYLFLKENLIKNHLLFPEHIILCEDWIFSISALLATDRFMIVPLQAYIYRQHEASVVHTLNKKAMLSLNIVTEQASKLLKKENVDNRVKEKLRLCIFNELTLNFWYLAHTPALYAQRKEIINDLKSRVPSFMLKQSFHQWTFSILYTYFPFFYVWLRHSLKKR